MPHSTNPGPEVRRKAMTLLAVLQDEPRWRRAHDLAIECGYYREQCYALLSVLRHQGYVWTSGTGNRMRWHITDAGRAVDVHQPVEPVAVVDTTPMLDATPLLIAMGMALKAPPPPAHVRTVRIK